MNYSITKEQKEAIEKLKKLKVGALFMDMGTGKTLTALFLVQDRIKAKKVDKLVWIAPLRTKDNFFKEFNKFGFEFNVFFVGIESIGMSDRIYLETLNEVSIEKTFLIIDESLKIKNNSKRSERAIVLSKKCEYKLILNGTPISKNFTDLYNQFHFLDYRIFNMSYKMFQELFTDETTIKTERYSKTYISANANAEALNNLIANYIYECKLFLNVSKKDEIIVYNKDEIEVEYEEIKDKILKDEEMGGFNFLKLAQKLQKMYSVTEDKIKKIKEILENEKSVVVFCKFVKSQTFLKENFKGLKVLSYSKHSFGLNLQEYKSIVFFDLTWDYATLEQAEKRIYRLGQKDDCKYIYLKCDCGLDEAISINLNKKNSDLESLKKEFLKKEVKK